MALVTLLGVETGRAAQMVRAAQQRLTQFDRLVFVLSAPDLVEATRGGAVVELLPGLRELAGHEAGEIRRYLESRQNQILQKWQPDVVLHYGLPLDAYILALIAQISGDGSNPF
ncbi:MAG: hypothetical protein U0934_19280 [Pseudotabrizicola sp.]|uniref:hypothetical protein n=1 Tax=Pseudotabrizicola sp. TaxID=2939647 RepID=UPI002726E78C|nr:hypothetical protein [Pseudotabrizicola sp.]MDO8881798.1 hypothetical protein [Pseudotabrizicola sp.]MDP2081312.1 hypothetical protein [Pseudotabrizicola sp.]MDZ7576069.1 hypothetical protein [Pseudotabrizicola sp.]